MENRSRIKSLETIYFRNVCYAKPQNEIAFYFYIL